MKIETIPVGALGANCYLVYDENTKEAMIVDPGGEGKKIMSEVIRLQLEIKYIVNTHGHVDHIAANGEVKDATKAPLLIHEDDANMLTNANHNLSAYVGPSISKPSSDKLLKDGDTLVIGEKEIKVIHTPGHTPGGICLLCDKVLLSGDTLFQFSVGRSDLPGGSHKQLINSIKTRLLVLEDDVVVYPGHGPTTTIGDEKRMNPFLV